MNSNTNETCKAAMDMAKMCMENAMNKMDQPEMEPTMAPEMPSEMEPSMEPSDEPSMDEPSMDEPEMEPTNDNGNNEEVIETFVNPNSTPVNMVLYTLLMMCLFYLLSHQDTMKYLIKNVKGLKQPSAHLLMTGAFGLCFLVLKKYL